MKTTLDKIKLIYEYDNDSPLFARVAESEINEGNVESAIQIIESGLKKYPDYVNAYLVYAETLARLNKFDKVIDTMEKVKELIDDEKTINYYLEHFEEIRSTARGNDENDSSEDDYGALAEKIKKAKMPKMDEAAEVKPFHDNSNRSIVSETLAGIYYSQGSYNEALEMYEKLLESNPNKAGFYREKINEIKNLIGR